MKLNKKLSFETTDKEVNQLNTDEINNELLGYIKQFKNLSRVPSILIERIIKLQNRLELLKPIVIKDESIIDAITFSDDIGEDIANYNEKQNTIKRILRIRYKYYPQLDDGSEAIDPTLKKGSQNLK